MPISASLEDIVLFIVEESPQEVGITKLMKLAFLADVEYAQLFGDRLCDIDWTWYDHGPFSRRLYQAVESLDERGSIRDLPLIDRRLIRPSDSSESKQGRSLAPPQRYALRRVLDRYGTLTLTAIKQVAYATQTMRLAEPGNALNVLQEPRRSLVDAIPALSTLIEQSPEPDTRSWGDPEESAAEDLAILKEFSALRREANGEIR